MTVKANKIVVGVGWVALSNYVNQIMGFVTTLILAKLLTPEDFGLVAVASMTIAILRLLKDMGLTNALIYRKGDGLEVASNTVFYMIVTLNLILFFGAVLISYFAPDFFDSPQVKPVIIILSSNLVWNSLRAVPDALIRKNIDFHKLIIPQIVPVGIASAVGILMAIYGYGVWSLVVRTLIVNILSMLLIWLFVKFRPSLTFSWKEAKDLLNYGKYIIGAGIFTVLLYNVDRIFVSKLEGIAALGFYTLAMKIANLPITQFSHIICRVIFPVFSKMNQDMDNLRSTFLEVLRYSTMIIVPMALGIVTYGPSLISNIYGAKWAPMVFPLQILSIYALFRAMSTIIHETFKATGNPNLIQRFVIIRLLCIGLLGIPAVKFAGLTGICLLIVGTYSMIFILESLKICKLLSLKFFSILNCLTLPFLASILLIPGIYWIFTLNFNSIHLVQIFSGIALTIFIYFLTITMFEKKLVLEIKKLILLKTSQHKI